MFFGRMDETQERCECCGEAGHDLCDCPVAQDLCESDGESDPVAGGVSDSRTSAGGSRDVHAAIGKRLRSEPKVKGFLTNRALTFDIW
jgi:hypothetical protein